MFLLWIDNKIKCVWGNAVLFPEFIFCCFHILSVMSVSQKWPFNLVFTWTVTYLYNYAVLFIGIVMGRRPNNNVFWLWLWHTIYVFMYWRIRAAQGHLWAFHQAIPYTRKILSAFGLPGIQYQTCTLCKRKTYQRNAKVSRYLTRKIWQLWS